MSESSTNVEPKGRKESVKRKKSGNDKEHIEVNVEIQESENGAKTAIPDLATSLQSGFAQMSRELAKTITESFKSFRSELEIEFEDERPVESDKTVDENHEDTEPPAKKRNPQTATSPANIDEAMAKITDLANSPSNEEKFEVLNSLKQDLRKEEMGPSVNADLANVVNAMLKDGLPDDKIQDKMNKYHRPENCEALTKVRVNQAVWDNLTPSVRSQDVKLQKVQTAIFKGMCALTGTIDSLLGHLKTFPAGNEILQKSTDALALFANANSELNHRRRELIKPDLHDEYKHLCSSSLAITDQLFGDDLPKQVKELTEVNRVGKKVSTFSGRLTPRPDYNRNSYGRGRGRSGNQRYRKPFLGSGKDGYKNHPQSFKKKKEWKPK